MTNENKTALLCAGAAAISAAGTVKAADITVATYSERSRLRGTKVALEGLYIWANNYTEMMELGMVDEAESLKGQLQSQLELMGMIPKPWKTVEDFLDDPKHSKTIGNITVNGKLGTNGIKLTSAICSVAGGVSATKYFTKEAIKPLCGIFHKQ